MSLFLQGLLNYNINGNSLDLSSFYNDGLNIDFSSNHVKIFSNIKYNRDKIYLGKGLYMINFIFQIMNLSNLTNTIVIKIINNGSNIEIPITKWEQTISKETGNYIISGYFTVNVIENSNDNNIGIQVSLSDITKDTFIDNLGINKCIDGKVYLKTGDNHNTLRKYTKLKDLYFFEKYKFLNKNVFNFSSHR